MYDIMNQTKVFLKLIRKNSNFFNNSIGTIPGGSELRGAGIKKKEFKEEAIKRKKKK